MGNKVEKNNARIDMTNEMDKKLLLTFLYSKYNNHLSHVVFDVGSYKMKNINRTVLCFTHEKKNYRIDHNAFIIFLRNDFEIQTTLTPRGRYNDFGRFITYEYVLAFVNTKRSVENKTNPFDPDWLRDK